MKLGLAVVRAVVGLLMFGHGAQKLFGWFGGHGLHGTAGFFDQVGLKPGKRTALAAGAGEAGGGALLALGFLTPLASAAIIGVMSQAIRTVHGPKGPWNQEGGWEYNAVLIAALTLLAEQGPGPASLDRALGIERSGVAWGLGALALGTVASFGAVELGRRSAPPAAVEAGAAGDSPFPDTAGDPVTNE